MSQDTFEMRRDAAALKKVGVNEAWEEYWYRCVSLDSTERVSKSVFYEAYPYCLKRGIAWARQDLLQSAEMKLVIEALEKSYTNSLSPSGTAHDALLDSAIAALKTLMGVE